MRTHNEACLTDDIIKDLAPTHDCTKITKFPYPDIAASVRHADKAHLLRQVFEAWTEKGKKVALKLLDMRGQSEVEQYWRRQEAIMGVQMRDGLLRHPNLMCPLDVFGSREVFCIVNEYAELGKLNYTSAEALQDLGTRAYYC